MSYTEGFCDIGKCLDSNFYRCTVHLDNVKSPFYQQMNLLLNI